PKKKKRVLVIDTDAAALRWLSRDLASLGLEAITAESSDEALTIALAQPPDVIVCELELPETSGFEVCRRIRQHHQLKRTRFVLMTAFGAKFRDDDEDPEVRPDAFAAKGSELIDLVKALIESMQKPSSRAPSMAGEGMDGYTQILRGLQSDAAFRATAA